jgi:hypothetical protein
VTVNLTPDGVKSPNFLYSTPLYNSAALAVRLIQRLRFCPRDNVGYKRSKLLHNTDSYRQSLRNKILDSASLGHPLFVRIIDFKGIELEFFLCYLPTMFSHLPLQIFPGCRHEWRKSSSIQTFSKVQILKKNMQPIEKYVLGIRIILRACLE